jgi:hypothetical protein
VHVRVDGAGGEQQSFAGDRLGRRAEIIPGVTPSWISGLPAFPIPAIRPSRIPTSAFTMPPASMTTTFVITVSSTPSARVAVGCWPIPSRMTFPPPKVISSP